MKLTRKNIVVALMSAGVISGGTLNTLSAFAQQPTTSTVPAKVEKIEVTGSNIKRVDSETIAPVQIITREEIQQSGQNTIADLLKNLSINQGGGFDDQSVNSFAPGAAGISLRGLGAKNTLILLNGRRMAGYGFAQNITDTFVDIYTIPASAVERIEILKSGASHIYGSDAIGGVINLILRKDFRGFEINGTAGTSTEGGANEYRTSFAVGAGDLAKDRYNVLLSVDYFKRDLLLWSDREYTKNGDFRRFAAGDYSRPGIAVYIPAGAIGAAPNPNRIPMPGCTGEVLTVQQINPFTALRGSNCVQNFAPWNTLLPRNERLAAIARGTLDISADLTGFVELAASKNKTFQKFQPPFIGTSNTFLNPATGLPTAVPGLIPANSPYAYRFNGVPVASQFQYVFTEAGGRDSDITSDSARILAGLKGSFAGWDVEAGAIAARSKVTLIGYNRLLTNPTIAVLNNFTYNYFDRNSPANAAVLRGMLTNVTRVADSTLAAFDVRASRELMSTANGPIGIALGLETRKETMDDKPDPLSRNGQTFGAGSVAVDGERRNTAIFAEIGGNLAKNVEVQAAVRHERYSDFGSKTVPGVGIKWKFSPSFLLRGNYSKGFRAPTLPENSKSNAVFFIGITDPVLNLNYQTSGANVGAGNLKPETSDNYGWGMVFEPMTDLSFAVDFYRIKQKDIVAVDDFNFILRNPTLYPGQITRSPVDNTVTSISAKYVNLSLTETQGVDFDARYRMSLGEYGRLTLSASYSYIDSFKQTQAPGQPPTEGVDSNALGALPRYRGTISALWQQGDWSARVSNRHIESYEQAGATPLPQQTKVGSRDVQDFFVSYGGFKNLNLSLSVLNVLNTLPPYDGNATNRYAGSLYDLRGRFVTASATYSFK
jgi:iron complex outermembrane recepter protein